MDVKPIPFTLGYFASSDGKIFDDLKRIRNTYLNGDGYETVCVKTEAGQFQTFGVHRLVCLAFKEKPVNFNYEDLVVNHRDLNKRNNDESNLEWLTTSQNNLHQALFTSNSECKLMCTSETGSRYYNNIHELCNDVKVDILLVWDCIKNNEKYKTLEFKYFRSKDPVHSETKKHGFHKRGTGVLEKRRIKSFDTESQEIKIFDSIMAAGNYFIVSPSHVFQSVSVTNKPKLFKRRYLIVDEDSGFPVLSTEALDKLKNPTGKDVISFNFKDKTFYIFDSASSFVRNSGLSKKAVTTDLVAQRLRILEDWIYCYSNNSVMVEKLKSTVKSGISSD